MKYLIYALLFLALLYGGAWTFNHVNPWLGILVGIFTIAFGIKLSINHIKQHLN